MSVLHLSSGRRPAVVTKRRDSSTSLGTGANPKNVLVSRKDNESKLLSEFVRAFMHRLSMPKKDVQTSLPLGVRRSA